MAGLRLKLRPGERLLINGAVVENGDRQVELRVCTPGTRILRLRDALHPDEVNTPVKRVCYIAQLAVAGEINPMSALADLRQGIGALQEVFTHPPLSGILDDALHQAESGNFYKAMHCLRRLLPDEAILLGHVETHRPSQPAGAAA